MVVDLLSMKYFSGFHSIKAAAPGFALGNGTNPKLPKFGKLATTTSNLPGNHGTSGPRAGCNCSSESAQGRESYCASYLRKWVVIRVMLML